MSVKGLLCSIGLFLFSTLALAQNTIQLINSDQVIRLSRHVKLLYETDQRLTLEQVLQRQDEFVWQSSENPNYGFIDNGLWLHTSFSNVTDTQEWVIDIGFAQLDEVDFYLMAENKLIAHESEGKYGDGQAYRIPTLTATLPYATRVDLFVRIKSRTTSLIAPLDIQTRGKHTSITFFDNLLWGLFYGGLLILAIYNFVLYFGNREPSLLTYVIYTCAVIFWQLVWGGHLHLLFDNWFVDWLGAHLDLIFVLIGVASSVFTITFLDASKTAPRTAPLLKFNVVLLVLLGLFSGMNLLPLMIQNGLVYLVSLFAISCFLFAGFESYFNHFHSARYFIFAWSILSCCALIGMLSLAGVLPSNAFTAYCFQVGVFIEAGLFSLALVDKSRSQLEQEVQSATDDLRNNIEFIEEQNVRLDIARKDAVKASNVKSQFLANMSHEIRTPLNAILGFSKELDQLNLPLEKQEHVRIINQAADNLLSIVNNVLDFSKIEAGKLHTNDQPFSPNQLLEDMVSVMAKSAHRKNLEFIYELSPLPEKLVGDITRIKQVLNNLLSNALKFTSKGHISLAASGEELSDGMFELQLKITDTGIGISQKDRSKLFTAFTQVDDALNRNYQGTGLGLVICKQLVKLMGGKITLSSTPGKGSCFKVTLRTHLMNKTYRPAKSEEWTDKKILLVDPYTASRRPTATFLRQFGAVVTSIESLRHCEDLTEQFDLTFLSLPLIDLDRRGKEIESIPLVNTPKVILLFSGPEPLTQHPHLSSIASGQMRLPLTPSKLESLMRAPEQSKQSHLQQQLMALPKARVLAVDDMEMNLRLLNTWLTSSALELTLAHSGQDAVNLCEQQEFDLILMDVQMPNMDGLQTSKHIRQTSLNFGTPIIAVTAHAFKEEQERLLASGMDDYLPKPLDLNELVNVIMRWCHQQEHQPVTLPSLDWELAVKRANHNSRAASELLQEFTAQLPTFITEIEQNWQESKLDEMLASVHKLHGVSCYTGVPKLQSLCEEVETALKCQMLHKVAERFPSLVIEADLVVSEVQKHFKDLAETSGDYGTA